MKQLIPPYLKNLAMKSEAINLQFKRKPEEEKRHRFVPDPLGEDLEFGKMKGLVHKYPNRALIKTTFFCGAHCQFCTRFRQIGSKEGTLLDEDVDRIVFYIKRNKKISDVILSGGDPLVVPELSNYFLRELSKIDSVKVIRIGTRLPIHNPARCGKSKVVDLLEEAKRVNKEKAIYFLVHINHADELTPQAWDVLLWVKSMGIHVTTQSVFLKGINDNYVALKNLFVQLYEKGIRPYYIYRCDYVRGIERFVCSFRKEVKITTELRKNLPGLPLPTHVWDVPRGVGKVPINLDFAKEKRIYYDYQGKECVV